MNYTSDTWNDQSNCRIVDIQPYISWSWRFAKRKLSGYNWSTLINKE
jgi:hypothetical protein